jgi:hypothetical protein
MVGTRGGARDVCDILTGQNARRRVAHASSRSCCCARCILGSSSWSCHGARGQSVRSAAVEGR